MRVLIVTVKMTTDARVQSLTDCSWRGGGARVAVTSELSICNE